MNCEAYIRQVKRELIVSAKQKQSIVRDLNEAFASAMEHGETAQQVIARLGSPKDFADTMHEQLGINANEKRKRKRMIPIGLAGVFSAIAFLISFLIKTLRTPKNVIGQANAMTSIQVEGAAFDPIIFWLLLGAVGLVITIFLSIKSILKK
jgi:hypothetical protein